MYAENFVQTHSDSVIATSVSVIHYESCLKECIFACVLVMVGYGNSRVQFGKRDGGKEYWKRLLKLGVFEDNVKMQGSGNSLEYTCVTLAEMVSNG